MKVYNIKKTIKSKNRCDECKSLPDGDVIQGHDHRVYDKVIRKNSYLFPFLIFVVIIYFIISIAFKKDCESKDGEWDIRLYKCFSKDSLIK